MQLRLFFIFILLIGGSSVGEAVVKAPSSAHKKNSNITTLHKKNSKKKSVLHSQSPVRISSQIAKPLADMQKAALSEGIVLQINSGHRTLAQQRVLYRKWRRYIHCLDRKQRRKKRRRRCVPAALAARPGHSHHEFGLALDINMHNPDTEKWLNQHAYQFGFCWTVPSEKWHMVYYLGLAEKPELCRNTAPPWIDVPLSEEDQEEAEAYEDEEEASSDSALPLTGLSTEQSAPQDSQNTQSLPPISDKSTQPHRKPWSKIVNLLFNSRLLEGWLKSLFL